MSEPKFSKGTWVFENHIIYQEIHVPFFKRLRPLFGFDRTFGDTSRVEDDANVALVVSAPEMYSLLEELATCDAIPNSYYIGKILKTLAKARGEK